MEFSGILSLLVKIVVVVVALWLAWKLLKFVFYRKEIGLTDLGFSDSTLQTTPVVMA